jgi:hypothetical protein
VSSILGKQLKKFCGVVGIFGGYLTSMNMPSRKEKDTRCKDPSHSLNPKILDSSKNTLKSEPN